MLDGIVFLSPFGLLVIAALFASKYWLNRTALNKSDILIQNWQLALVSFVLLFLYYIVSFIAVKGMIVVIWVPFEKFTKITMRLILIYSISSVVLLVANTAAETLLIRGIAKTQWNVWVPLLKSNAIFYGLTAFVFLLIGWVMGLRC